MTGRRAQLLCERLLPYMQTKRAQAALVCEFPVEGRVGPGVQLAAAVVARRLALAEQISALNHA